MTTNQPLKESSSANIKYPAAKAFNVFFKGRDDVSAEQLSNGQYIKLDRPVTDKDISDHLAVQKTYGIYLINPKDNSCHHTVIDIDDKDPVFLERIITAALKTGLKQSQLLIEFSGSKGHHVWISYPKAISAEKARKLGKIIVALSEVEINIEVFPKQESVSSSGFGCLIKLPLGLHKKSLQRSYFLDDTLQPVSDCEKHLAAIEKVELEEVDVILNEFDYLLPKSIIQQPAGTIAQSKGLPCFEKIMREGVAKGGRNNLIFLLAKHFKRQGMPLEVALATILECNKKNSPPLSEKEITDIVNSAYKHEYSGIGCENELLKKLCSPECPVKAKSSKVKTNSNAYAPVTLLEVKREYNRWLYIEDQDLLDIVPAVIVANKLPADPLWLLIVSASGNAKTEMLRPLSNVQDVHLLSTLTGQTLVSGFRGKGRDPSLLPKLNNKILVIKDFTSVLCIPSDERKKIFSQLREAYDGSLVASFGSDAQTTIYKSKFGVLGACTPEVDKISNVIQLLGERFLYYRPVMMSRKSAVERARANKGKEVEMRQVLSDMMCGFLNNIAISEVTTPPDIEIKIEDLSLLISWLRSSVSRNGYSREIAYTPEPEIGTRLVKQFLSLAQGLALVRGKDTVEAAEYEVLKKVARSTLTNKKRLIFQVLYTNHTEWKTTQEVGLLTRLSTETAKIALEDYFLLDVCDRQGKNEFKWKIKEGVYDLAVSAGF